MTITTDAALKGAEEENHNRANLQGALRACGSVVSSTGCGASKWSTSMNESLFATAAATALFKTHLKGTRLVDDVTDVRFVSNGKPANDWRPEPRRS